MDREYVELSSDLEVLYRCDEKKGCICGYGELYQLGPWSKTHHDGLHLIKSK
jgi:hypothetical protein